VNAARTVSAALLPDSGSAKMSVSRTIQKKVLEFITAPGPNMDAPPDPNAVL
jgi:hypothetical protein